MLPAAPERRLDGSNQPITNPGIFCWKAFTVFFSGKGYDKMGFLCSVKEIFESFLFYNDIARPERVTEVLRRVIASHFFS